MSESQEWTIRTGKGPDILVRGSLLGTVSTERRDHSRPRWMEADLIMSDSGTFLLWIRGRSSHEGERTRHWVYQHGDGQSVFSEPGRKFKWPGWLKRLADDSGLYNAVPSERVE